MTQASQDRWARHQAAQEAYRLAQEEKQQAYKLEMERLRQRPPAPVSGPSAHAAWNAVYAPSREKLFSEKAQMQARRERNANPVSWANQMRQAPGAKGQQDRIERGVNPEDFEVTEV